MRGRGHLVAFTIAAVLSLVVVAIAAASLLGASGDAGHAGPEGGVGNNSASSSEGGALVGSAPHDGRSTRPECPGGGVVAGVELDCLEAEARPQPTGPEQLTVANVWAWWCGPCREELPVVAELARRHPEINVVGVHADPDAAQASSLLTELGIDLPSYQDPRGAFKAGTGIPGVVPVTVLVRGDSVEKILPAAYTSVAKLERDLGLEATEDAQ
ncbi:hypothetical protein CATYP_01330 [Corynebacterium atypicum]|uniref:Thioredoxin domain-containing protein n=1 Tax=Corynebacterium atypicum TaxID=191610 RepID=A0ABM5QLF4_9CORY|nr:TlpA disulfide reductase family protein [Corynebacterium atypicum]AIG63544.1 hypothetical protein CATYP_01330 [Corynebacterium atypicum]